MIDDRNDHGGDEEVAQRRLLCEVVDRAHDDLGDQGRRDRGDAEHEQSALE
jgi:hypothetical protein